MMVSPLLLVQNRLLVTACDGTMHVYYIQERKWEKCAEGQSTAHAFPFPDMTSIHSAGLADSYITETNMLLEASGICNIFCRLKSSANRPMLYAALLPGTEQDSYQPLLVFVGSSKTATSANIVQSVYKIANRKPFGGKVPLKCGYNLEFPAEGTTIKPKLSALIQLKSSPGPYTQNRAQRQQHWINRLGGTPTPTQTKTPKSGEGHNIELQNIDVRIFMQSLANPLEAEARLRVNVVEYKGGGLRSKPLPATASFKNILHSITGVGDNPGENYILSKAPLSDYHISQKGDEFFGKSYAPSTIIDAVESLRARARKANMAESEFQPVINAVMSSFFEDIGWRLADIPAVAEAAISKAAVDIDQVHFSFGHGSGNMYVQQTFLRLLGQVTLHIQDFFPTVHNEVGAGAVGPSEDQKKIPVDGSGAARATQTSRTPLCDATAIDFIKEQYHRILTNGIFCANSVEAQTLLFAQKSTYNRKIFFLRKRQGGHTYMNGTMREQYVRINPDERGNAVFHVSVARTGVNVEETRREVWASIVVVATWWGKHRPGCTDQDILQADSIVQQPEESFDGCGGALFSVLVALYYGHFCANCGLGCIDLVLETYGTKRLASHFVPNPAQPLHQEDNRPRQAAAWLQSCLRYLPPCQVINFGQDIEKTWYKRSEITLGVGCTVSTVRTHPVTPTVAHLRMCQPSPLASSLMDDLCTLSPMASALKDNLCTPSPTATVLAVNDLRTPSPTATVLALNNMRTSSPNAGALPLVHIVTPDSTPNSALALFPVISCCSTPWEHIKADPKKYFDHESSAKLKPFVPKQHSSFCTTFPVYGNTFPQKLQPTTFSITSDVPNLRDVIEQVPGKELMSQQINRVQQYSVTARHAVGQGPVSSCDTVAKLSALPVFVSPCGRSAYLDTGKCLDQVRKFSKLVESHFELNVERGGGSARIEVAVACNVADDVIETLQNALADVMRIAQERTLSYDFHQLRVLSMLMVGALESRMECGIAMHTFHEVAASEEFDALVVDIFGAQKEFFTGMGAMTSKQKTLPRLAFMNERPILAKLLPLCAHYRREAQTRCAVDWLEEFYQSLNSGLEDVREIPDFRPVNPNYRAPPISADIRGKACPRCFIRFFPTPSGSVAYVNHLCPYRAPPHEAQSWINLSSPKYQSHHNEQQAKLTAQQKLLLEVLHADCAANLYLGGFAGTGKSTALRVAAEACCMKYGMSSIAILAPTHITANNIGGRTIASFLGAKPSSYGEKGGVLARRLNETVRKQMQRELRFLFIDEVGMITAEELDRINVFLCDVMTSTLNEGKTGSFGGLKVILSGDPLQVLPIGISEDGFFFQSKVFCAAESKFLVLYLKQILRTADPQFIDFLSHGRVAYVQQRHLEYGAKVLGSAVTNKQLARVKRHLFKHFEDEKDKIKPHTTATLGDRVRFYFQYKDRIVSDTCLFEMPRPDDDWDSTESGTDIHLPFVATLENSETSHLTAEYENSFTDLRTFYAEDVFAQQLSKEEAASLIFSLPYAVRLGVGMRVRVLWNSAAGAVCKDSIADIMEFSGDRVTIWLHGSQKSSTITLGKATERIENAFGEQIASRAQIPLQACVAGNHHYVQGQTLHKVPCIYANERLTQTHFGATYTVLSRFVTPEYIQPLHQLKEKDFKAAEAAVQFDQFHAQQTLPLTAVNYRYDSKAVAGEKNRRSKIWTVFCACNKSKELNCPLCCNPAALKASTLAFLDNMVKNIPEQRSENHAIAALLQSRQGNESFLNREPARNDHEFANTGDFGDFDEGVQVDNTSPAPRGVVMQTNQGTSAVWGEEEYYWPPNELEYPISTTGVVQSQGIAVWTSTGGQTQHDVSTRQVGQPKTKSQVESTAVAVHKRKMLQQPETLPPMKRTQKGFGQLKRIGTLTLPTTDIAEGNSEQELNQAWLCAAFDKITDTYKARDKSLRTAAKSWLEKEDIVLEPGLSRDMYWYYAFRKEFPGVIVSLQALKASRERAMRSRTFNVAAIQGSTGTMENMAGNLPSYCELLVTEGNNVYEFADRPTDARHCLWSNVI